MLCEFLLVNRAALIDRCRTRVVQRLAPKPTDEELEHGIPMFIDQLIEALRLEQMPAPAAGPPQRPENAKDIGATAQRHGRELMRRGFSVEQVVRDYGDLCQEITGLALTLKQPIEVEEFRVLNRCLDDAIADAVTEFAYQHDTQVAASSSRELNERFGFLAHELRNFLHTASLAVLAMKSGTVGLSGATGAILDRSLTGMRELIERSLAEVRLTAGSPAQQRVVSLADFIGHAKSAALLEADARGCALSVAAVDPALAINVDWDMMSSALGNLLQNAFKFTHAHSEVKLSTQAAADRISISVEDHCGGLPAGDAEKMFLPFTQRSTDKSGLGLGLAICRRAVEANQGTLSVRDLPGSGCVFTINLPRHGLPGSPH